jgi:hypothetical protein
MTEGLRKQKRRGDLRSEIRRGQETRAERRTRAERSLDVMKREE